MQHSGTPTSFGKLGFPCPLISPEQRLGSPALTLFFMPVSTFSPRFWSSGGNSSDVIINFRGVLKVGVQQGVILPIP